MVCKPCKRNRGASRPPILYMFTQLVVPIAVRIAVITDAKICSVHLMVSFFVIVFDF